MPPPIFVRTHVSGVTVRFVAEDRLAGSEYGERG
jgi:hypothetical protein